MMNRVSVYPWDTITSIVANTVERYAMFGERDKVLVAVSGGPDSVALLHILETLAPFYDLQLTVAHLNHGLRPRSSDREARFVVRLARRLGIKCLTRKIDIGPGPGSLEERARNRRYDFLNRTADAHGCNKIALGHQANDNAEAVLMHLLRGSGIRGLAGIPPVRGPRIVRPLIHLQRTEVLAYLNERSIDYVQDESNQDLSFARNRIRHELIPLLEQQYNPNIVATLHRTADLCHEEESWLQNMLEPMVRRAIAQKSDTILLLGIDDLQNAPLGLQRRTIRDALRAWRGHLRRITAAHIDAVANLLPPRSMGKRLSLPGRITVQRTAGHLCFETGATRGTSPKEQRPGFCHMVRSPDDLPAVFNVPHGKVQLTWDRRMPSDPNPWSNGCTDAAWFDLDRLCFPLTVRSVMPGDRLTPFGMGGSQKLKKLLIDRKIPRAERDQVPILLSARNIIWVAGIRRSATAPVTTNTNRTLTIRMHASAVTG